MEPSGHSSPGGMISSNMCQVSNNNIGAELDGSISAPSDFNPDVSRSSYLLVSVRSYNCYKFHTSLLFADIERKYLFLRIRRQTNKFRVLFFFKIVKIAKY